MHKTSKSNKKGKCNFWLNFIYLFLLDRIDRYYLFCCVGSVEIVIEEEKG